MTYDSASCHGEIGPLFFQADPKIVLPPVPPEVPEYLLRVRVHQVCPCLPQGMADVVDEAHLGLFDAGIVPVTHGTDVQAKVLLVITLSEKFLHDAVDPVAIDCQRLCGVGQVGTMHHVLKNLLERRVELVIFYWKGQCIQYTCILSV